MLQRCFERGIIDVIVRVLGLMVSFSALAVAGGCVSTSTYGTGVSAERQLLNDVTNIFALGESDEDPVVIEPRAELVVPPDEVLDAGAVNPPADPEPDAELASVWPVEPETVAVEAVIDGPMNDGIDGTYDERNTVMTVDQLNVVRPAGSPVVEIDDDTFYNDRYDEDAPELNQEVLKALKKKKKKSKYALDGSAVPVRQYLIEPPSSYRVPADGVEIDEEAAKRRDKLYRNRQIADRAGEPDPFE